MSSKRDSTSSGQFGGHLRGAWVGTAPLIRILSLLLWVFGLTLLTVGIVGDMNRWWDNRPFVTNVVSSATTAAFGLPVALIVIQRLVSYQQRIELISEASARVERFTEQLQDSIDGLSLSTGHRLEELKSDAEAALITIRTKGSSASEDPSVFGQIVIVAARWKLYLTTLDSTASSLRSINALNEQMGRDLYDRLRQAGVEWPSTEFDRMLSAFDEVENWVRQYNPHVNNADPFEPFYVYLSGESNQLTDELVKTFVAIVRPTIFSIAASMARYDRSATEAIRTLKARCRA